MKVIIKIASTFLAAFIFVGSLQLYSHQMEGKPNGFRRAILKGVISDARHISLGDNSYYIIALRKDKILLGTTEVPGKILSLPFGLTKMDTSWITLPDSIRFAWGAAKIYAIGEYILLAEGITPKIFEFKNDADPEVQVARKIPGFGKLSPLPGQFAIRTLDTTSSRNIIAIYTQDGKLKKNDKILIDQQDGIFSTDGILLADSLSHRWVYIYYYRNQLTSFDNDFNNINIGKTIDTVSRAKINLSTINSERKIMFSSPPLKVNKHACTWQGLLFIYSALRADNEKSKLAFTSSIIDVYRIADFSYAGTFYIPNYDKKGIRDFAVYNNRFVALRGNDIFTYVIDTGSLLKPLSSLHFAKGSH